MTRTVSLSLLDNVRIASPCPVRWVDMRGDAQVRHCDQCNLNVYNLSEMTREAAETLLRTHEGRLCAGVWRRADGTVITRDCPVGLAAVRAALGRRMCRMVALLGIAVSAIVFYAARALGFEHADLRYTQPFQRICDWLSPQPIRVWTAGDCCLPPPVSPAPLINLSPSSRGTN